MRSVNLGLRFLLELCMLAGLALWGAGTGSGTAAHLVFGIGAPLAVAIIWGLAISPRARIRLGKLEWVALQLVLFSLTAVALAVAGHLILGIAFDVAAVLNLSLLLAQSGGVPEEL